MQLFIIICLFSLILVELYFLRRAIQLNNKFKEDGEFDALVNELNENIKLIEFELSQKLLPIIAEFYNNSLEIISEFENDSSISE